MATKKEILDQLATLDKSVLSRLSQYAEILLIPSKDILVNPTMGQLLDRAFSYADANGFTQWSDRSHGDFGRFLVELMALFSEKNFWYLNRYVQEAHLSTITQYLLGYLRARSLGYSPIMYQAATMQVEVTFPAGASYTFLPGEIQVRRGAFTFSNDAFTLLASGAPTTLTVTFREGFTDSQSFNYSGRNLSLPLSYLDLTQIRVQVNSVYWNRKETFADSNSSDTDFIAFPNNQATAEVAFGDNTYGQTPALGADCVVQYLRSSENVPVLAIGSLTLLRSPTDRSPSTVVQLAASTANTAQESLSSLKVNAPRAFLTQDRIVNESDAIAFLSQQPEVVKSRAQVWYNTLFFQIIPADGSIASPALLTTLESRVAPKLIMGFIPSALAVDYIDLGTTEVDLYVYPGTSDLSDIELEARSLILDITDPVTKSQFGANFYFGILTSSLVGQIAGVQNAILTKVQNTLTSTAYPDGFIPVLPNQIIQKIYSEGGKTTTTLPNGGIESVQGFLTIRVNYITG